MSTIVIYKTKYGATKRYAEWIAEELQCEIKNVKEVKIEELEAYDTVIYGGGLYAEIIDGVTFITRNIDKLKGKKIIVYSTGITPLEYREYYEEMVVNKNFKPEVYEKIKMYNFLGKMLMSELSVVHKSALKMLKQIMQNKENPTEMETLLIKLCDMDEDLCDKNSIKDLVEYAKK